MRSSYWTIRRINSSTRVSGPTASDREGEVFRDDCDATGEPRARPAFRGAERERSASSSPIAAPGVTFRAAFLLRRGGNAVSTHVSEFRTAAGGSGGAGAPINTIYSAVRRRTSECATGRGEPDNVRS